MLLTLTFTILLLFFSLPILFLTAEVFAALLPRNKEKQTETNKPRPSVAILIPAHNEEDEIAATLKAIKEQLFDHDRILVVADNCNDRTVEIAQLNGAEVLERLDAKHRGKGYALDFGMQFLKKNPPDVVIIFDADVTVEADSVDRLARTAHLLKRPVQAKNLLEPPTDADAKTRVSTFAFLFKNMVRPLGLSSLGGGCLLTGTGMAFPWDLIKNAPLASSNIVEDMQLGIDLAIAGNAPIFCPDATVKSKTAPNNEAAHAQRMRWEHGHLLTIYKQAGRTLKMAIKQQRFELILLSFELAVPPLSSLVLLWCAAFFLSLICSFAKLIPTNILTGFTCLGMLLSLNIFLSWWRFGRHILSFSHILTIPLYILWKTPIYLKFLLKPQKDWVRTERSPKDKADSQKTNHTQ